MLYIIIIHIKIILGHILAIMFIYITKKKQTNKPIQFIFNYLMYKNKTEKKNINNKLKIIILN